MTPSDPPEANSDKVSRYYLELTPDLIISTGLALIGLIRLLSDQWMVWPLLGTNRVYLQNNPGSADRCNLETIQTRITYIQSGSSRDSLKGFGDSVRDYLNRIEIPSGEDLSGFEIFTMKAFQEMSVLEKIGLIRIDRQWYSIMDLYQAGISRSNDLPRELEDPLTRIKLSPEINQGVHEIIRGIPGGMQIGFPLKRPILSLIETRLDHYPDGTPGRLIEFDLQPDSTNITSPAKLFIWAIPDFRTDSSQDWSKDWDESERYSRVNLSNLTLDAIDLITTKYSSQAIFQDKRSYQDAHLNLHPKMLYLCERSYENLHSFEYRQSIDVQVKDLEESLNILEQI